MPTLNKLWAGKVYGTNTGNLFIEFTEAGSNVAGILRFRDDAFGIVIYKVSGTFGEGLRITGVPQDPPEGVKVGNIEVEARLTPEGHLRGQWKSALGTGGTFEAYPHDVNSPHAVSSLPANSTAPEQIFSRNIPLRALRLFAEDLRQLIAHVKEDFNSGRVVVTYNLRGSQVTRYGDQFLAEMDTLERLNYLKVNIQEPEAHGINRVVTVELSAFGTNEVRVQGIRESWVIGKAEAVVGFLRQRDSTLLTTYRKFGLNLNSLIFVVMLVIMPSLTSWQNRAYFASGIIALLVLLFTIHVRLIPNTLIILGGAKPTFWSRMWPQILSGVVTVATTIAGGLLLYWLTKVTPNSP